MRSNQIKSLVFVIGAAFLCRQVKAEAGCLNQLKDDERVSADVCLTSEAIRSTDGTNFQAQVYDKKGLRFLFLTRDVGYGTEARTSSVYRWDGASWVAVFSTSIEDPNPKMEINETGVITIFYSSGKPLAIIYPRK